MKKAIYILTGVMASGKSTVGEVLALRLGEKSVHLRGDIFRRMIPAAKKCHRSPPKKPSANYISDTVWRQKLQKYTIPQDFLLYCRIITMGTAFFLY